MTLSDEEKQQLRVTWTRDDGQAGAIAPDDLFDAVESIVTARERDAARRALLDAADAATCDQDPPCGTKFCADANKTTAEWLRDRADTGDNE